MFAITRKYTVAIAREGGEMNGRKIMQHGCCIISFIP
jgi:hypothetical protein